MTNETLILDITNPQEQLISYNGNMVGFYDSYEDVGVRDESDKVTITKKPVLYIYIKSSNDRFTVNRRKAISRKVKEPNTGNMVWVEEVKLYARAYARYLEIKQAGGISDPQKIAMSEEIASLKSQLANKPKRKAPVKIEPKEDRSAPVLEAEALNESK